MRSPTRTPTPILPSADRTIRTPSDVEKLAWGRGGLLPVVTQDHASGAVLMLAWVTREALTHTLSTGWMHYWSRSREELWRKGATSGNVQRLVSLHGDCDGDAVLALVDQQGPACHTDQATCFGAGTERTLSGSGEDGGGRSEGSPTLAAHPGAAASSGVAASPFAEALDHLGVTLAQRAEERPEGSYTTRLLGDENLRLKKLGEETAELIHALAKGGPAERIREEGVDLLYHLLVALLAAGVTPGDLAAELESRRT